MASVDDVLAALNDQINTALIAANVTNEGFIAPGWPNMTELTKQMEQVPAQYFVSIYPLPTERVTTRFLNEPWGYISTIDPTVTASISGNVVSFSGAVTPGQNVALILDPGTSGAVAHYQTKAGDTLADVALGVAAQVVAPYTATPSGDTVAITSAATLRCNVGGSAVVGQEVLRTDRHFQISVWCPDAPTRSLIFNAIKRAFASVYFLTFPDTSSGRLKYVSSPWSDEMQQDTLYFLKAVYSVEWGEIAQDTQTQIVVTQVTTTGQNGPSITTTEG